MTSPNTHNSPPRLLVVTDDAINGGTAHLARQLASSLSAHFELAFAGNLAKHPPAMLGVLQARGIELHDYTVSHDNPAQQAYGTVASHGLIDNSRPDLILFVDANIVSLLALKGEAARLNIPFFVIVNSLPTTMHPQMKRHLWQAASALRFANTMIFVCEPHRRKWRALFPGSRSPETVIRNFCDDIFFAPRNDNKRQSLRNELGIQSDDFLCLTAARLSGEKGQLLSLRALKLMADRDQAQRMHFVYAGPATPYELGRFHEEVAKLKLGDRVSYLGSRNDIGDLMDASDCFVLTSRNEGTSLSVAEAMAKGLPIIATDVGDMSEIVTSSCGAIIPSPAIDENACTTALVRALEDFQLDGERLKQRGLASRLRAQKLFKSDRATAEYVTLLLATRFERNSIAASKPAPEPVVISVSDPLDFSKPMMAWNVLLDGWSISEPRGIWSIGPASRLRLQIRSSEPRFVLRFLVKPFLDKKWTSQTTEVRANGRTIAVWQATRPRSQTFDIDIDLAPNETTVELTFLNRTAASPYELGLNKDERYLSFFFRKMFVLPTNRSLTDRLRYAALRARLAFSLASA